MTQKSFIERIANGLSASINSKIIFADPIEKDDITIIPVSRVRYGFGAGIGRKNVEGSTGKGAGGGFDAYPVGYIEIRQGHAKFVPIKKSLSLPAIIIASGFASIFFFRGLARLFRRK